jgi:hypothetical protein
MAMLKLIPPLGRELLDEVEIRKSTSAGSPVIFDEQRRRPRYFDGRFLAARDLTREQAYFLSRQSSLGQVLGAGVVTGLLVGHGNTATSVQISAGYGLTLGGELVALDDPLKIELADVVQSERLNVTFGLRRIPGPPSRGRSGLFVIGLRPVEFTANPAASYPTSLDGPRTLQDGDIVEASAVTLVPYPEEGTRDDPGLRRARVAKTVFVDGSMRGIPTTILPLALVSLDRGTVEWIDNYLVRREVGAGHPGAPALGVAPQALRESHLMQYELHLQDVLAERKSGNRSPRFAAAEHFLSLPAAGRLPVGAIDPASFIQYFFPAEMDVDLSFVPMDEIPALLRDSLMLPPIDLTVGSEALASTPVLALVGVDRKTLADLGTKLTSFARDLKPAVPGAVAKLTPLEQITALALPGGGNTGIVGVDPDDQAWADVLGPALQDGALWYIRRRNLSRRLDRPGTNVILLSEKETNEGFEAEEPQISVQVLDLYKPYRLEKSLTDLRERADAEAWGTLAGTFVKIGASRILLEAALREAEAKNPVDEEAAQDVAKRFVRPQVRQGLQRLAQASPHLLEANAKQESSPTGGKLLSNLGYVATRALVVPEIGEVAYALGMSDLPKFADDMKKAVGSHTGKTVQEDLRALLEKKLEDLKP